MIRSLKFTLFFLAGVGLNFRRLKKKGVSRRAHLRLGLQQARWGVFTHGISPITEAGSSDTRETDLKLHQGDQSKSESLVFTTLNDRGAAILARKGPDQVVLWFAQSGSIPTSRPTMQAIGPNIDHCQTPAERWSARLRLCIANKAGGRAEAKEPPSLLRSGGTERMCFCEGVIASDKSHSGRQPVRCQLH